MIVKPTFRKEFRAYSIVEDITTADGIVTSTSNEPAEVSVWLINSETKEKTQIRNIEIFDIGELNPINFGAFSTRLHVFTFTPISTKSFLLRQLKS